MDLNPLRYLYITRAKVCKQTIRTVVLGVVCEGLNADNASNCNISRTGEVGALLPGSNVL